MSRVASGGTSRDEITVFVVGTDLEGALKRFERLRRSSGLVGELERREYYTAPSLKRRKKRHRAKARRARAEKRRLRLERGVHG